MSEIQGSAFENTALQKINIPYGVVAISKEMFKNCKALRAIYIPASINEVGNDAFYDCGALKDVYYQASETAWLNILIRGYNNGPLTAAELHTNALPMVI